MESGQAVAYPKQSEKGHLLRILGVGFGIAVTIGGTFGVGILRTPGTIAAHLGNVWLFAAVWAVGAVYALFGTIAAAELGTSLPKAGGWYVYARRAFGDYAGFTVGWTNWISYCTALASLAIALGDASASLIPALAKLTKVVAISLIVLLAVLHWVGLKTGSRAQGVTSAITALAFVGLIIVCFALGGQPSAGTASAGGLKMPATFAAVFVAIMVSLQSVIFTYDGWYGAIYFAEEDSDPGRHLPRAMLNAVVAIIVVYAFVNLAFLYVLPLPQMAASQLPASDAARAILGPRGGTAITLVAMFAILSVTNATVLQTPRILFAMSRDGLFSSRASKVNRGGTPSVALLLTAAAGIALVASGTFDRLLAITSLFFVVMYCSGFIALFALRKREPDLPRPFLAWGYPWTTMTVIAISAVFLIGVIISDTANSLYAIALLAISYPVYLATKKLSAAKPD